METAYADSMRTLSLKRYMNSLVMEPVKKGWAGQISAESPWLNRLSNVIDIEEVIVSCNKKAAGMMWNRNTISVSFAQRGRWKPVTKKQQPGQLRGISGSLASFYASFPNFLCRICFANEPDVRWDCFASFLRSISPFEDFTVRYVVAL